ncbi:MAG TPA: hypothetical protein VM841_11635 [Actinomycetota bacterium]|nr:hypothetical protein [Actinomycetota bacterium]
MSSRARFAAIALLLVIGGAVAFAASRGGDGRPAAVPSTPATLTGNCLQPQPEIARPGWYPDDLPMPEGSYAIDVPPAAGGLRRVVFSVSGDLTDFVRHALGVWPKHGWSLGVGESEPGEAEDNFLKGERYGIFRARSIMCDQSRTWVLMVLNDPAIKDAPTPGFNTNPGTQPSPLKTD